MSYTNTVNAFREGSNLIDEAMTQKRLNEDQAVQRAGEAQEAGAFNAYAAASTNKDAGQNDAMEAGMRGFGKIGNALADRWKAANTDADIEKEKKFADQVGSISHAILSAENPEKAFAAAQQKAPPEVKAVIGSKFDPDAIRITMAAVGKQYDSLEEKQKRLKLQGDVLDNQGRVIENKGRALTNAGKELENISTKTKLDADRALRLLEKERGFTKEEEERLKQFVEPLFEKQKDPMQELSPQEQAILNMWNNLGTARINKALKKEVPGSPVNLDRTTAGGIKFRAVE